jgi:hypothetical protein
LRGAVLSSAFNLEHALETLVAEFLFPTPTNGEDALSEKRSLFKLTVFRELNFERKTRIAADAAKKILCPEQAEALATALGNARQLRNLMAHYPCWLEPIKDGQMVTGYRIFIEKGKSTYELSDNQIGDWLAMVNKTLVMTENTLRRLTGELELDHPLDQPKAPSQSGDAAPCTTSFSKIPAAKMAQCEALISRTQNNTHLPRVRRDHICRFGWRFPAAAVV